MARVPKKVVRKLEDILWDAKAVHSYLRLDKVVVCHKGEDGVLREMPKDDYVSGLVGMQNGLTELIVKYKKPEGVISWVNLKENVE